jgi:hypothetical protein
MIYNEKNSGYKREEISNPTSKLGKLVASPNIITGNDYENIKSQKFASSKSRY